jgi:cytochrome c oxidase subunit 5b
VVQRIHGILPAPVPAAGVLSPRRWFNASAFSLSGHAASGQLDEFGIATGAEREELEYQRQGKKRFDLDPPRGPFGTKEAPAIIESNYDERVVGCSGGIGEDEHDVTWFTLEKGQSFECPVCTQVFELKVIGPGGKPGSDEHH